MIVVILLVVLKLKKVTLWKWQITKDKTDSNLKQENMDNEKTKNIQ
jgi:hypothetical protein